MKKTAFCLLLLTCNVSAAQYCSLKLINKSIEGVKDIMTKAKCPPIQNWVLRAANGTTPIMFEDSTQEIHQTIQDPLNRQTEVENALLNACFPVKEAKIFGKFLALKTEAPSGILSEIYKKNDQKKNTPQTDNKDNKKKKNVPHISLIKLTDNEDDKNILSGIYYKMKAESPLHTKKDQYQDKIKQIIEEENRKEDFKTAELIIVQLSNQIKLPVAPFNLNDNIRITSKIIAGIVDNQALGKIKDKLQNNLNYQNFKKAKSNQVCPDSKNKIAQNLIKNRPLYYFIMKHTFCHDVFYDETSNKFIIDPMLNATKTFPITNGQAKELCSGNLVNNTYQNPVKIFYSVIFESCKGSTNKTADDIFAKFQFVEAYITNINAIISTSGMKPLKFENIIYKG